MLTPHSLRKTYINSQNILFKLIYNIVFIEDFYFIV